MIRTVNIDTMPAGREMDALVAEKVMGMKVSKKGGLRWRVNRRTELLSKYSTSISAAWEVVEKLKDAMSTIGMAGTFNMEFDLESGQWEVGYTDLDYDKGWCWEDGWPVMADTAPLAICRASLKAKQ